MAVELVELIYELEEVTDWYTLGLFLKLKQERLEVIEKQHKDDPNRCKMEMLKSWLRFETTPTWLMVAVAVKRMDFVKLSEDIVRKRRPEIPGLLSRSGPSAVPDSVLENPPVLEPTPRKPQPCVWRMPGVTVNQSLPVISKPNVQPFTDARETDSTHLDSPRHQENPPPPPPPLPPPSCLPNLNLPLRTPQESKEITSPDSQSSPGHVTLSSSTVTTPSSAQRTPDDTSTWSNTPPELPPEPDRIRRLKVRYAKLQDSVLKIIHREVGVDIYRLQAFIQQLPVILEDPSRKLPSEECLEIRRAAKIFQIFATLGKYIDYDKYHLLEAVVCTFGNPKSMKLMSDYVKELESPSECDRYLCPNCAMEEVLLQDAKRVADMKRKFASLLVAILRILEDEEKVNLRRLEIYIRMAPLSNCNLREFQENEIEELHDAKSVSHIFSIVCNYISFDGYFLLECVVEQFGNDRARRMMQEYIRELEQFQHSTTAPALNSSSNHEEDLQLHTCTQTQVGFQVSPATAERALDPQRRSSSHQLSTLGHQQDSDEESVKKQHAHTQTENTVKQSTPSATAKNAPRCQSKMAHLRAADVHTSTANDGGDRLSACTPSQGHSDSEHLSTISSQTGTMPSPSLSKKTQLSYTGSPSVSSVTTGAGSRAEQSVSRDASDRANLTMENQGEGCASSLSREYPCSLPPYLPQQRLQTASIYERLDWDSPRTSYYHSSHASNSIEGATLPSVEHEVSWEFHQQQVSHRQSAPPLCPPQVNHSRPPKAHRPRLPPVMPFQLSPQPPPYPSCPSPAYVSPPPPPSYPPPSSHPLPVVPHSQPPPVSKSKKKLRQEHNIRRRASTLSHSARPNTQATGGQQVARALSADSTTFLSSSQEARVLPSTTRTCVEPLSGALPQESTKRSITSRIVSSLGRLFKTQRKKSLPSTILAGEYTPTLGSVSEVNEFDLLDPKLNSGSKRI